jgi:hypothetical protein
MKNGAFLSRSGIPEPAGAEAAVGFATGRMRNVPNCEPFHYEQIPRITPRFVIAV